MIEIGKEYEALVSDFTVNGDGVAKIDSFPLFIKGTVPGDKVRFKVTKLNKNYGFGSVTELIVPSQGRRESVCPSFDTCGGCLLLNVNYDMQLKFKSDFVLSNIQRIGGYKEGEFEYEPIIGAENEYSYRNKAQFPVGIRHGEPICGFYLPKSHQITPCEKCNIQDDRINSAVKCVMSYINKEHISVYNEKKHGGIVRHIYVRCGENEIMVAIVTNSSKRLSNTENLIKELSQIGKTTLIQNINTKRTNVVLGYKNLVLSGNGFIHIELDSLKFKVSPESFFQVNTEQMKKLYNKALEYASPTDRDTVFDLYCGVGSISLYMARMAGKVIGVEIVPGTIDNAKENAKLNHINNISFYCGDAAQKVNELISNGERADIAVVDPPRKGCDEELLSLLKDMSPRKIVYVSCNSATLARDVAILRNYGYVLKKCCPVDMFPQTMHVECVVCMQREDTSV